MEIDLTDNGTEEKKQHAKMAFDKLTIEAKFALYAILNTPGELSKFLFADNQPTKKSIQRYLCLMGWKLPAIRRTLRELHYFTKEIYS